MKKILYIFQLLFFVVITGFSQTGNVGIGTITPEKSAILDVNSDSKGFLIPRMTIENRNLIAKPANGLLIYQTNNQSGFYYFDGNKWKALSNDDQKSITTLDANGWSLDGNEISNSNKNAALSSSFIGTPSGIPLNFKIGGVFSGRITSAGDITSIGHEAGQNTSGSENTAFGFQALRTNTSGNNNTAIGAYTMRSSTGGQNTAIGSRALFSNTIGYGNTALGTNSLNSNLDGFQNLAFGASSMYSNQNGSYNVALGLNSLYENISGTNNMAIGTEALRFSTGSFNTAIGTWAGRGTSLYGGSNNIFIGYTAGANESGSNKLYISPNDSQNPLIKGDFLSNNLQINSKTTGYLAIGDFSTATSASPGTGGIPLPSNIGVAGGYRLVVQDGILCEKVKVALRSNTGSDWADYVFEPEYKSKMMSLEEVEEFTIKNKHLPNVPSEKEMISNGLDVAKVSKMFMEKIEELTIYMIELNKEIKSLKVENDVLRKKL